MKKIKDLMAIILPGVLFAFISFQPAGTSYERRSSSFDGQISYGDGIFEGTSRSVYTDEPYWGIVKLKIENGLMKEIRFIIRDSSLHENFNKDYAVHFKGNALYLKQCRKDSKGVIKYPKKLYKSQDPDNIDAMSGATWSYNIFKASVNEALKKGAIASGTK